MGEEKVISTIILTKHNCAYDDATVQNTAFLEQDSFHPLLNFPPFHYILLDPNYVAAFIVFSLSAQRCLLVVGTK